MQCRFCHCNERTPCQIPVTADEDGSVRLARPDDEVAEVLPCQWYLNGVCNAPRCIEKLIAEWRGEEVALDLAADQRDFEMIGRELGILAPEEVTRESILERVRELRRLVGRKSA